jgi:phosphoglycolate phosphatase-like HAD superfamily hydrolase
VVLGLLTGNYAHAVPLKLAAAGIDPGWFPVGAFGDEAESRPALVELARERYRRRHGAEVAPGRVVLVGDTPRDVHAALANGALAFAVATGKYSVEELLTSGAHRAVKDLSDPAPLLRLIEDGGPAGNG